MEISALFDNVDMAESALVRLQALGIFPERYKIRSLYASAGRTDSAHIAGGWGGMPASPIYTNAVVSPPYDMVLDNSAFEGGEPPSQEVQLTLTVGNGIAARTRSALISNYGRQVRTGI
ncbi:MAG: hypothetical protein LBR76_05465 [Oscillospiraceae bacterium]|jgi:hypothetical protein|nr:hypothetical protein [Oscillospiraceae bacterium]